MDLRKCYIDTINDENNKIVQLILFTKGCTLAGKSQVRPCTRYLYINERLLICHNEDRVNYSSYSTYKEILLKDILKL